MKKLLACLFMLALAPTIAAQDLQVDTVADGLENPWSLAFLPDGRMLVTERAGRLRIIENGTLLPEAVSGVPSVYANSQGGLFEVLPAPDFADSGMLYLSLASGTADANSLLVVRGRLQDTTLTDVEEIFRAQPLRATPVHYGARMLWLPDGTLLVGYGDGFDYREDAQRLSSHTGSVFRLNADGSAPVNNPFQGQSGASPEIFTYGHRNVQGIAYDPTLDRIWQHEHGPRGGDELNILTPGTNYGWPIVAHAVNYSGARVTPFSELPGIRNPVHIWQSAIAPGGLAVYRGELFSDWNGNVLVAGLGSRAIHRLVIEDEQVVSEQRLLQSLDQRMRDVRVGPDGAIYVLTDHSSGSVLRITP
ncbi:MAG: PQQ-dependent sugar dehydrogenase [Pseudohongiella sp.]